MQQCLNRYLGMRRIGPLQNFSEFCLHLIGTRALLPPALAPCLQQQRLARIGVMITRQNQRRAGFQARLNGLQNLAFGLVAIEVMKYADQSRGIEGLIRRQVIDLTEMHLRSVQKIIGL